MIARASLMEGILLFSNPWRRTVRPSCYGWVITGIPAKQIFKVAGAFGTGLHATAHSRFCLVEARNYARIGVEGKKNERILKVQFKGVDGKNLYGWSLSEKQLMR